MSANSPSATLKIAHYVNRSCLPGARVEHSMRHAFVAGLVRIIAAQSLGSIRARPVPGVHRASQGEPKSVHAGHDLYTADTFEGRLSAQNLSADFRVYGKKLSCCQV